MIGYDPDMDYLYDPQQAPVTGFCERCRREVYRRGERLCSVCREALDGYEE